VEPATFDPRTANRSVAPTSVVVGTYVELVAPLILEQEPFAHRSHSYEYAMGEVPVHVPGEPVNVAPTVAWPLIVGADVFVGAVGDGGGEDAAATTAVGRDVAGVDPNLFDAVTTTFMVLPTSAEPNPYVVPLPTAVQLDETPHRCQE